MVGTGSHAIPFEVVSTMIEMADVACYALEHRPHRRKAAVKPLVEAADEGDDMARLRSENLRLRNQLVDNVVLLQDLHKAPKFSDDCPPDLYTRLLAAVDSSSFLSKIESARDESKPIPKGISLSGDMIVLETMDVPIVIGDGDPSWWVWIPDIIPGSLEEISQIDNENYVIVTEEDVIDSIANFVARCILEDPKSKLLSPEEIQKAVTRALVGMRDRLKWKSIWEAGKIIYTLASWGLVIYGLYTNRAILKAAANGVSASANFIVKAF